MLSGIGEQGIIEKIARKFGSAAGIPIGIGDDAAAIDSISGTILVTTDLMAQDVHFSLAYTTMYQLGFKLVSVNVSDIYAMNGRPAYLLLTMALPVDMVSDAIDEFLEGIDSACKYYGVSIIGGDTSSSRSDMVISATVIGFGDKVVSRYGARPGDFIYVTGPVGDSATGLILLQRLMKRVAIERGERVDKPLAWEIMRPLLERHLMPRVKRPEINEISAMMDVSDGIFIDLKKLCKASGVGARVFEERIPVSESMSKACHALGLSILGICGMGEDYEYLFTSSRVLDGFHCIGTILDEGFELIGRDGGNIGWMDKGYEHFKQDKG